MEVLAFRNVLSHKIGDHWSRSCDPREVCKPAYVSAIEQEQNNQAYIWTSYELKSQKRKTGTRNQGGSQ